MANGQKMRTMETVFLIAGFRLGLLHVIRGRFDQSISPLLITFSMSLNCRQVWSSIGLKLLYWNCRGICSCREELQKRLEVFDVFVGVETNHKNHKKFDLSSFHTYRIDRTHSPGGGIIFLVRKSLKFTPIQDLRGIMNNLETGQSQNTLLKFHLKLSCLLQGSWTLCLTDRMESAFFLSKYAWSQSHLRFQFPSHFM